MEDSPSGKSLGVFDDGRGDNESVRTNGTNRASPGKRNPLQILQSLETVIVDPRATDPTGTQTQNTRNRSRAPRRLGPTRRTDTPRRTDDHRASTRKTDHRPQELTRGTRGPQPPPPIAPSHRAGRRHHYRSRSPPRRAARDDRHRRSDHHSSNGRDRMPPPKQDPPLDSPAIRKLARSLRDDNRGRERFDCFPKDLFASACGDVRFRRLRYSAEYQ